MVKLPQKSVNLIQGVYYYLAFGILIVALCVAVYWQIEPETVTFEDTSKTVILAKDKKDFVAEINYCTEENKQLRISRYYRSTDTFLIYQVPEAKYQAFGNGCSKSIFNGYVGRLEPGNYTYHVLVAYDLNPIRQIEKEVSVITLKIE